MLLAIGLSPLVPSAAAEQVPDEAVVPAALRSTYLSASLVSADMQYGADGAGAHGLFHRLEGHTGVVWTSYATGESIPAPTAAGSMFVIGTGSDVLAYRYSDGRVGLWDATDGTMRTLQVPGAQTVLGVYGNTVVTYEGATAEDGTTTRVTHLLTPGPDGTIRDVVVQGPAGMVIGHPRGTDGSSLLFLAYLNGGTHRMAVVDRDTGQVQGWTQPLPSGYTEAKASPEHIAVRNRSNAKVLVVPRTDLSATPTEVTLDGASSSLYPSTGLAVVGDWLVYRPSGSVVVKAQPIAGGASVSLLSSSNSSVAVAPDGTALVIGRTATGDWGIQRIRPGDDGTPSVTLVKPLPKPPVKVQGLSLEQGRLIVTDPSSGRRDDYIRTVAASGTPEFGDRSAFTGSDILIANCPTRDPGCSQIHGTADGRIAWLDRDGTSTGADRLRVNGPAQGDWFDRAVPADGRITDVSGRYVIHTSADQQHVYRLGNYGAPTVTRAPGAAALWGDVLWTAGNTPGSVTGLNLTTKTTTQTLTTDAPCVPEELQAVGRWLYWSCGPDGQAGVYDRTAQKSVPVPSGEARLGDGYVVSHDKQAGELVMTTVADGSPSGRVIGKMPDTGVSQRDVRWTVDESGANAAYVDDQERVHLVPSGAPTQPLSLLAPADNARQIDATTFDGSPAALTTVLLSKPSADWRLTVRSEATGKVVDTRDGGSARGELSVHWHGADRTVPGDVFFPSGKYAWTLSVTPADGTGAPLEVRGTVILHGAELVHRDHAGGHGRPDGTGDLLTLNSSGGLTFQQGDGQGAFSGKTSGSGWSTSVVAVPFGDLNGDLCNDVLIRMTDGSLRGYKPMCGQALTPALPYTKLGTGWSAYNVLTSAGDLTGDKRADLLARKSSTGDIYLFAAKSDGTLAAGKKIRSAWTYTHIVGAGDLTGDGIGDVLARRKDGTLYRYNGTGTGLLKERVKVFADWGGTYNAIVGVGDITGDGRNDIVARDKAGYLYRNDGNGTGSFSARTKIATGWGGYKGVF